jgi:hypothetical protein
MHREIDPCGDNIAPRADDVWDHKKLLKVLVTPRLRWSIWRMCRGLAGVGWRNPRWQTTIYTQLVEYRARLVGRRRQGPSFGPCLGHRTANSAHSSRVVVLFVGGNNPAITHQFFATFDL